MHTLIIKLPVTTAKQRQIATDLVPEIAIVVKTNRLEDERDGGHYGFHQTKLECRLKLEKDKWRRVTNVSLAFLHTFSLTHMSHTCLQNRRNPIVYVLPNKQQVQYIQLVL